MKTERVVVVTGAGGGIGKEVVKKFLDNGYFACMLDIADAPIEKAINDMGFDRSKVAGYTLDISSEEQVKSTIAKIVEDCGRIDALVNTAGICGTYAPTIDYTFENFKRIYEINTFGTFLMMKYTLPQMVEQKKGAIVNFGSVSGMTGYTWEIGYGSSKWAVIGMTKNVANEYAEFGIRANSVSPGWVDTNMLKQSLDDYNEITGGNASITLGPMGRTAKPVEIANGVYWLCTDDASYVNSTNLLIDGGMMLG
ncbi:MAG: SDR family oxidoreductase [Firmicutes bacterium]|nr:SDR family oxidoreductase [Bacillota bacterium]MBQ4468507.1 SDR family oxidoreductase [Bacillota bacterium]